MTSPEHEISGAMPIGVGLPRWITDTVAPAGSGTLATNEAERRAREDVAKQVDAMFDAFLPKLNEARATYFSRRRSGAALERNYLAKMRPSSLR